MIRDLSIKLIIFSILILIAFGATMDPETYNNYMNCIRGCNARHIPVLSASDIEKFSICYRQCRLMYCIP